MLIVQKFGGSSLENNERICNVAKRIGESYDAGHQIVVVLSAQGKTTDELIRKAKELNPKASRREVDMLLTTGEQQSVALMAIALHSLGYPAVSLTAMQTGIHSSSAFGNARIRKIVPDRIRQELEKRSIVIVTGFQGYNRYGDLTTLGRGGSDTTAVALAATLHADLCEIYTDVEGVYTADPRLCENAFKLDEITYDEMLELASLGAKVLHNRSVELAKKHNVNLVVRSSLTRTEGTLVKEEYKMEKMFVSGIAVDHDVARIALVGVEDTPGMAYKIFSLLSKNEISVDIIIQSIGQDKLKDISFTVTKDVAKDAFEILKAHKDSIKYNSVSMDDKAAKLSIVGAGMATNPGVASTLFEALYDADINIKMISTSEIKISVLIDEKDVKHAANFVHDKFYGKFYDKFVDQ